MSVWLERQYLQQIRGRLGKFRQGPRTATFRCPFCGDSKRNPNKTRGYIYPTTDGGLMFKCHNCNEACRFPTFLKRLDPELHRQFLVERFRESQAFSPTEPKKDDDMFKRWRPSFATPDTTTSGVGAPSLRDLPADHVAVQYVERRQIPRDAWGRLHFTDAWATWMAGLGWAYPDLTDDGHPRLVIPWYSETKDLLGAQVRRIDVGGKDGRYMTFCRDPHVMRLFGREVVSLASPVYVVEGPLDSLFLPNAVASMASDIMGTIRQHFPTTATVAVWDNEPYNREIVRFMTKAVEARQPLVIWPTTVTQKDINDMVLAGVDVLPILQQHTYVGLRAELRLAQWRKNW